MPKFVKSVENFLPNLSQEAFFTKTVKVKRVVIENATMRMQWEWLIEDWFALAFLVLKFVWLF